MSTESKAQEIWNDVPMEGDLFLGWKQRAVVLHHYAKSLESEIKKWETGELIKVPNGIKYNQPSPTLVALIEAAKDLRPYFSHWKSEGIKPNLLAVMERLMTALAAYSQESPEQNRKDV